MTWPITIDDVRRAAARIAPHLSPTALRDYAPLDAVVGGGIRAIVLSGGNVDLPTLRRVVTEAL